MSPEIDPRGLALVAVLAAVCVACALIQAIRLGAALGFLAGVDVGEQKRAAELLRRPVGDRDGRREAGEAD